MTDALNAQYAQLRSLDGLERATDTLGAVGEVRPIRGRPAREPWRDRGWLTPTEYAEATQTKRRTVQFWCARGWLPTLPRDGHDWRIAVATLYELHPSLRPAA